MAEQLATESADSPLLAAFAASNPEADPPTVTACITYEVYGEVLVPGHDGTGREVGLRGLRTSEVRFDPAALLTMVTLIAPLDRCQQTTIDGSR